MTWIPKHAWFARKTWRPYRDLQGIVHLATRLTVDECAYVFNRADGIRSITTCSECCAIPGVHCRRRDGVRSVNNHPVRVRRAREIVRNVWKPKFGSLHAPACTEPGTSAACIDSFGGLPVEEHVNCMACLAIMTEAEG